MENIDWNIVETIVDEVLELPEENWFEFVEKQCEASPKVKSEVTKLLKSILDSEGWLEDAATYKSELFEPPQDLQPSNISGKKIGVYRIKDIIGHGGMGSVYLAERDDGNFKQTVALKLIRREMATPTNKARFKREQQILAGLNHPHISHLFDGGLTQDGRPYFVMEYIEGKPITDYCDEKELDIHERLKLSLQICDALQYAHQNLVIHRDLKPSNILVTDDGQVKLLDFGIAKVLSDDFSLKDSSTLTKGGQMVFTPEYASPEQLDGSTVSTASDIYALAIVLYELLASQRPYNFKGLNRVQMVNELQKITIQKPSTAIKDRSEALAVIPVSKLRYELDDIVLKGLRMEADLRYESVEQFSNDISNYLNNRPVIAKGDTRKYRLAKFLQRNRHGVSLVILSFILLFAGVAGIVWQANKTQQEAERALAASERVIAVKDFLENMITAGNPWTNPNKPQTARDLIDQGAQTVEGELNDQPALAAELLGVIGASYQGMREDSLANHYLSRAMALTEAGAELDPLVNAKIHAEYAGTLLRLGQPGEAETLARETLKDMSGQQNARKIRSQLLSMLANAQSLLGNAPAALTSAQEAADLVCNSSDRYIQRCINAKMELRHFYEWAGNFEAGLEAAGFAYQLADSTKTGISEPMRLTVVGNYGNALSYNAQTTKAIPLLKNNVELALKMYGENSYRYARALHDLVSAYMYAGQVHEALPRAEHVFEIGGTAQPGNPMNSYWLHQIFHMSLDLRMPDRAENAYGKYEDDLPERMSDYYIDAFDVEYLRVQALNNPGNAAIRKKSENLLEKLREQNSPQLPNAALLAAEQAVEAKNADDAEDLLNEFKASLGAIPPSDVSPARAKLLNARRLALLNDLEQAMNEARESLALLREIGHRNSPFVAETQAVMAELHCRMNEPEEGQTLLDKSRQYWREIAEVPDGLDAMEKLAPVCLKSVEKI